MLQIDGPMGHVFVLFFFFSQILEARLCDWLFLLFFFEECVSGGPGRLPLLALWGNDCVFLFFVLLCDFCMADSFFLLLEEVVRQFFPFFFDNGRGKLVTYCRVLTLTSIPLCSTPIIPLFPYFLVLKFI